MIKNGKKTVQKNIIQSVMLIEFLKKLITLLHFIIYRQKITIFFHIGFASEPIVSYTQIICIIIINHIVQNSQKDVLLYVIPIMRFFRYIVKIFFGVCYTPDTTNQETEMKHLS